VVVDREEDNVSLADDRPDVGLVEELGDRLDGEPIHSGDPGQGLGLVRAQIAVRAGLSRSVPRLEDVAVDEDKERARLGRSTDSGRAAGGVDSRSPPQPTSTIRLTSAVPSFALDRRPARAKWERR